jgi:RNA polymerase sigma-70 factor, ECF subfamily
MSSLIQQKSNEWRNRTHTLFEGFDAGYYSKLKDRDAETEWHFVSYFTPLLTAKLRRRLYSDSLVDDIIQETFLRSFRAIRSMDSVKRPEQLGAFVNAVCENVIRENLRWKKKTGSTEDDIDIWPSNAPSPESQVLTRERKSIVQKTLSQISSRDREILKALFFEERDKDEVCRELGVDRNYLRVLLHRAKVQFRVILQESKVPV